MFCHQLSCGSSSHSLMLGKRDVAAKFVRLRRGWQMVRATTRPKTSAIENEKNRRGGTLKAVRHVGLLFDKPPGRAGLSFS